jgi:hypothetical protein
LKMSPAKPLILIAALSLVLTNPAAAQSSTPGFTVGGVVVQGASNQPVRRARVTIAPVENRQHNLSVATGSAGEFSFSGLPKGKYSLEVESHGTVQGFHQNEGFSTAIAAGPGLDSEHIVFPLEDSAAISGSVVDDEGDPVRGAQVLLFHRGVFYGRPQIAMQGQVNTGATGEFHFRHLLPGTYFVGAQGMPWFAQHVSRAQPPEAEQPSNRSELDVTYPVTYHADSTNPAAASPVTLAAGGTAEIHITLRAVPALHVRLEGIPSQPEQNIQPQLSQVGPGGILLPVFNTQSVTLNDQTEIMGMAPGSYILKLQQFSQGQAQELGVTALSLASDSTLDAGRLSQARISGQIFIEGTNERPPSLAIWLADIGNGQAANALLKPDGTFDFDSGNVAPGRYQLRLENGGDFYIKSSAVKGAEYSRGILTVRANTVIQISIVAARGLANVDGIAVKDRKPFAGAMVLALPEDPSGGAYIPRDQSDSDGTFTLPSAPPGRYALVAIDNGRDFLYREPSVIAPYLRQARIINFPLRGGSAVQVEVQHREP